MNQHKKKWRWFLTTFALTALMLTGCGGGGGGQSQVPTAPAGVSATPGDGQTTIAWAAVSGATSYNIYYSTTAGVTAATGTKVAGATSPADVTGLTNDTVYYFIVTAVNSAGQSAASAEVSAAPATNPAPAEPTGVKATAGNGQVTLAWTAVSGATSYNLYYGTSSGVTIATGTKMANVTSGTNVTGLANGTPYYFIVTALNTNGESAASSVVSATPSTKPFIQATVLSLAKSSDGTYISSPDQVEVCTDGTCSMPITDATVNLNGTALTYDSNDKRYKGSVAIAAGATVSLKVTVNGTDYTATGTQFTTFPSITAPAANASWAADVDNAITWNAGAPTSGATYAIGIFDPTTGDFAYPAQSNGPEAVSISNTSATVPKNALVAGDYYAFAGIGTSGITDDSSGGITIANAASGSGLWIGGIGALVPITVTGGTAPTAPTGLSASGGDGQITLNWTAVTGAASYNVYFSTSSGVTATGTPSESISNASITVTGLTNGTTYYFVVTVVNAAGESGASSPVSATPVSPNQPPAAPTGVTATAGNGEVTLHFSAVTGAASYNVYYSTSSGVTPQIFTDKGSNSNSPITVTGLTNGTPYYFVVTAVNTNGESNPSSEVTATPSSSVAPFISAIVLTVSGTNPIGWDAQIQVCSDGSACQTPITNATVTVNNTALPYNNTNDQAYEGTVGVSSGALVTVSVTVGATTYTASGTQFTSPPTISAPTLGTTWTAASDNTVSWTGGAPTTGASYFLGILDTSGKFVYPSGNNGPTEYPTGTSSATVPGGSLTAGTGYAIMVGIGTQGLTTQTGGHAFSNQPAFGSGLWLGNLAPFVGIFTQ